MPNQRAGTAAYVEAGHTGQKTTANVIIILYEQESRAILGHGPHDNVLAAIEARSWRQARHKAIRNKAMDPYFYRPGRGWFKKDKQCCGLS